MHPYVLLRNQYQNQRGKKFRHSLYWIFPPGIALESWKILSGNFLFLELKNPGKFCPGRKLSWNFLKIISQKEIFFLEFTVLEFSIPGIFHSWNSVLELSVPGILFHGIFLLPFWYFILYVVQQFATRGRSVLLSDFWRPIFWILEVTKLVEGYFISDLPLV